MADEVKEVEVSSETAEQTAEAQTTQDTEAAPAKTERMFTQRELEDILKARLAREKEKMEEEKKRAQMTELERLNAEKADAERRAAEAVKRANERLLLAEAKSRLLASGVKAEKAERALKVLRADLTDIPVDEDGAVDTAALETIIRQFITDFPEFAAHGESKAGADFAAGNQQPPLTAEIIAKMTPEELKANWARVTAYYANQQK